MAKPRFVINRVTHYDIVNILANTDFVTSNLASYKISGHLDFNLDETYNISYRIYDIDAGTRSKRYKISNVIQGMDLDTYFQEMIDNEDDGIEDIPVYGLETY